MAESFLKIAYRTFLSGSLAAILGCTPISIPGPQESNGGPTVLFPEDSDAAHAALPFTDDELLVRPFPGATTADLQQQITATGAEIIEETGEIGMLVLRVEPGTLMQTATTLTQSDLIESIHKNYILTAQRVPNDALYVQQPHLPQIAATEAWELTVGTEDILIAIVDTGIDVDHPDLSAKIEAGRNVFDNNADFDDAVGHGTQAAGCAAALTDNALGVSGVAWHARMLAVRATDPSGQSTSRHLAAGILWAAGQGADVINVSFAPLWSNVVVQAAATSAANRGAMVVISAGNGGGLTTSPGYSEALFVGAVSTSNGIAGFSDRGPFVDLVAPGTAIRTTTIGGTYGLANGTSFAAPLVSAVAALAWSVNPELPAAVIREAIVNSATDLGTTGPDGTFGGGIVNARAAVEAIQRIGSATDVTFPTVSITSPRAGAELSGRSRIRVSAADARGVSQVVLLLDELPVATDTFAPFEFVLDAALHAPGDHTLAARATDASGNDALSREVAVTFSGAGSTDGVRFRSPASGASVSGNVTLSATVSSAAGLASIEWLIDGESVHVSAVSGVSSGVSYLWRTGIASSGPHTITLVALDNRGVERSAALELIVR